MLNIKSEIHHLYIVKLQIVGLFLLELKYHITLPVHFVHYFSSVIHQLE